MDILDAGNKVAMLMERGAWNKRSVGELTVATTTPMDADRSWLSRKRKKEKTLKGCYEAVGRNIVSRTSYVSHSMACEEIFLKMHMVLTCRELKQLVVPMIFRQMILKLAQEGIMAGHQGTKRPRNRILREFVWPDDIS